MNLTHFFVDNLVTGHSSQRTEATSHKKRKKKGSNYLFQQQGSQSEKYTKFKKSCSFPYYSPILGQGCRKNLRISLAGIES